VDWKEDVMVQIWEPGHWVKVQFLCFTLGFSRKTEVRVSEKKDLSSFLQSHQEALRSLGGLPEVIRTDCLKSAIVKWKGSRSVLNESYQRYLGNFEIHDFPARPGTPEDKGKGEKRKNAPKSEGTAQFILTAIIILLSAREQIQRQKRVVYQHWGRDYNLSPRGKSGTFSLPSWNQRHGDALRACHCP